MFRHHSTHSLMIAALCSCLVAAAALERYAHAATGDVVDLEADTHNNPPASTTDKSTPPRPTTEVEKATKLDTKEINDATKDEVAEKKLKLRAGEQVGGDARGTAQVLGMSLQEGPRERVKVVEVAMNSPAFAAGVMKGDEIIAFQGFRGESYRKWIDGIRRLTADTRSGLKIPLVVARDGEKLTVRIVVPERTVVPPALAQPGRPLIPPGIGPAIPTPGSPTVAVINGGNNVAIANSGPFREFFGGQAASANERAMAQIFRIGANPGTNTAGTAATGNAGSVQNSATAATTVPIGGGARIGLAGFRDDPSGMVVMVDVGTLPPGNYTVGISDPSIIGGATGTGAVPDAIPPTGQVRPSTIPPTGEVNPSSTPPTGQANPSSSTPTGQLSVNNAQPAPAAQPAIGAGENNVSAGVGGGTLSQIGTITVDQSGTGRMQQTVESVRVRDVVGQAIVLYSQDGSPQRTLPANLNGTAGTSTQRGPADAPSASNSQHATDASGDQGSEASQTAALQQAPAGSQVPVAAGIIQLVNDRRPPDTIAPQTSQTPSGTNRTIEQPASTTPPAGQNIVR